MRSSAFSLGHQVSVLLAEEEGVDGVLEEVELDDESELGVLGVAAFDEEAESELLVDVDEGEVADFEPRESVL